jgi:hypothetical protein
VIRLCAFVVLFGASLVRADVVTSLSGSHLVVTGDASADRVVIGPAPDGVTVAGVDGTLVDGSSAAVTVPGVQRLTVKLGRGADRLTIGSISLAKKLDVRLGRGNDRVALDGVQAGATRIRSENGHDDVSIAGRASFKRLSVQAGSGRDSVSIDGAFVRRELAVDAGDGNDLVSIVATEVIDDVDVHLGDDDDACLLADVILHDDVHLDGDDGEDEAFFDGYVWVEDEFDVDGFGVIWR